MIEDVKLDSHKQQVASSESVAVEIKKAAELQAKAKAAIAEQEKNLEEIKKVKESLKHIDLKAVAKGDNSSMPDTSGISFAATKDAESSAKDPWKNENAQFKQDQKSAKDQGRKNDGDRWKSGSW